MTYISSFAGFRNWLFTQKQYDVCISSTKHPQGYYTYTCSVSVLNPTEFLIKGLRVRYKETQDYVLFDFYNSLSRRQILSIF